MASFEPSAVGGTTDASAVVPAQLGFLAIYNPSLGTTDETLEDQIVYFASAPTSTPGPSGPGSHGSASDEERNERLRQIGLAQGMVAFGRSFAGDQAVDTIETDKARVILHEIEPGWWILASIDLTRLPTPSGEVEYSSREVKPAALLLQDLLRAHSVFLLHHNITLQALLDSCPSRPRFTGLLARYWDVFLSSWSVLLHGNPVRDVLPGLRMAACGELGIGVGEEERGSGEREVLEGLVTQTEGLVDLVVCKYGELPSEKQTGGDGTDEDVNGAMFSGDDEEDGVNEYENKKWLGTGSGLGAEDGAIFLGVGALSRPSLRSLTYWMEDVYTWGQNAYGIAENPSAPARKSRRRTKSVASPALGSIPEQEQKKNTPKQKKPDAPQEGMMPPPSLLPPPPVTQLARRAKASTPPIPAPSRSKPDTSSTRKARSSSLSESAEGNGAMDKYMSIVKLGYGTYWGLGGGENSNEPLSTGHGMAGASSSSSAGKRTRFRNTSRPSGRFLIPLLDNDEGENKDKLATTVLEPTADGETAGIKETTAIKPKEGAPAKLKAPSPLRSVFVDVLAKTPSDYKHALPQGTERDSSEGASESKPDTTIKGTEKESGLDTNDGETGETGDTLPAMRPEKLRVVVYAQRPFLYTFLFEQQPEDSNAAAKAAEMEKVAQILIDRQLSVLHKPMIKSTLYRPDKPSIASGASAMLSATMAASSPPSSSAKGNIYDLIWDPGMLTIHSTIPNIPEPYSVAMLAEANSQNSAHQEKRGSKAKQSLPPVPQQQTWSRVEALNTHMQILNMYAATRSNGAELERMCKTSRGWWIVWNRLVERAPSPGDKYGPTLYESDNEDIDSDDGEGGGNYRRAPSDIGSDNTATARPALGDYTVSKEIILIRRSSDHPDNANGGSGAASGGGLGSLLGSGSGSGLGGFGRASSAMRAFSASAYLGFGGGNDTGTSRDSTSARTASPAQMDAAGAEELAAVAAERSGAGGAGGAGWADGAGKIAQGIGVDTKKYIEGLLTLNR